MSQIFGGFTDTDSGGDVDGPASATNNDIAAFDGTTGKLIKDSGILYTSVVVGPASATDDKLARYDGTTGKLLQDGGPTYTDAGLLTVVAASMTTGLQGIASAAAATAGYVGEFVSATLGSGSATSITSNTAKTVTSISLTAGDWDVTGLGAYLSSPVGLSTAAMSISTTNNTRGTFETNESQLAVAPTSGFCTPVVRLLLSSTTTVYLVAFAVFSSGTLTACGSIRARRMR